MNDWTRGGRHRAPGAWSLQNLVGRLLGPGAATPTAPKHPSQPGLTRQSAILRAILAVPPAPGLREWLAVDAVNIRGVWWCVLADHRSVHLVEVDAHTGQTRTATLGRESAAIAALPASPAGSARPRGYDIARAFRCPTTTGSSGDGRQMSR